MIENIQFFHPSFLWLLLLVPLYVWYWLKTKNKEKPTLTMSSLQGFGAKKSKLQKLMPFFMVANALAIAAIVIALARPQSITNHTKIKSTHGIDIVMAIDVSGSMLAKDLQPNRLEALKKVANNFIDERINDRVGLVVYAAEAYTKTPVTSDKTALHRALSSIAYDQVIQDGTAIGVGLGTAVNRLRDSQAKSKVIILLTDGVNNAGVIDPMIATEIAKERGIKVYTIGIGTNGVAESPYFLPNGQIGYRPAPVVIDEDLLKNIAKSTAGKYFRATDSGKLQAIYDEINQLEKTKIDELKYVQKDELYRPFVVVALLLLTLSFVLRKTLFKGFI